MKKLILNPDLTKRNQVLVDLKANDGYCPCCIEQSEDTKCKCKEAREKNICICGLYTLQEDETEI